jgi:hypothetical protein
MRRIGVGAGGVMAVLLAVGAGPSAALVGPRPAAGTFSGTITSATGRYAGAHGGVVIRDANLVSHASGALVVTGVACHHSRHCLTLSGKPVGSLTLKGHPIPDTGFTYTVSGSGRVGPLGHVTVSGQIQVPGFVACGHQTMTLTFTGSRGRVKVAAATPLRCAGGPPD